MEKAIQVLNFLKSAASRRLVLLDQAVVSMGNFLQSLLLARALGVEVFGVWAFGQLGLLLVLSLNQAFLTSPMLTFLGKKNAAEKDAYLVSSARLQFLVAGLFATAAAFTVAFFFQTENLSPVQFGCAVLSFLLWDFARRFLLAEQKISFVFWLDVLLFVLQTGGIALFFAFKKLELHTAWWIWAASYVIPIGVAWAISYPAGIRKTGAEPLRRVAVEHWLGGRWLLATAVLQWFAGNFFVAAAGIWLGAAALGLARMAQNVLGVLNVVLIALENTLPVSAARAFQTTGWAGMSQILRHDTRRAALPVAAFLLFFGLGSEPVFRLLFGSAPEGTSLMVWGYVLVYALAFVALPLRVALRTLGQSRAIFVAYSVSAAFSLVFADAFLKHGQMLGMVAGLVVCQIVQLAVCLQWLKKTSLDNTLIIK